MNKKLKKMKKKIIIGIIMFFMAILFSFLLNRMKMERYSIILYMIAYFWIGGDVIKKASKNICSGRYLDENFLMCIATLGAFGVGEYPEAVAVMLFYQIGEWFQSYAINCSRKSIKELMNIRPDYANVIRLGEDGKEKIEDSVDPLLVSIGDTILIRPGEKIPLDGMIIEGSTTLDTSALTGESIPREAGCHDEVISGCINLTGIIKVQVKKLFTESTVSKILELVETASTKKAETENFITRFARYYTPFVVFAGLLLAVLPPLILNQSFLVWLYRALSFLVISCPCALVISIPLSFFGGLGAAGKSGILIKGSTYLEALSKAEIVALDKTGTLTKGVFSLKKIVVVKEELTAETLLKLVAQVEYNSNHPISISIKDAYMKQKKVEGNFEEDIFRQVCDIEEMAGLGRKAKVNQKEIFVGNEKLIRKLQIDIPKVDEKGTIIHVADADEYYGYLLIADEEKDDAVTCVKGLKKAGIQRIVLLTGDRIAVARELANKIGIKEFYADLLPGDKVDYVENLMKEKTINGKLVYVGDGINDAPVLARADIGIAMGGLGQDAAIEAADVVIMTDEPGKIMDAIQISKKTNVIVKQNIVLALGVKFAVLILAASGFASMWAAVFADVGVAFLAIINAMRTMKGKRGEIR